MTQVIEIEQTLKQLPNDLTPLAQKILEKKRIEESEALYLFEHPNRNAIQLLADLARKQAVGDTVYFASTYFVHPTNLCELSCPLCSYYAKPGWKNAWFLKPKEIAETIRNIHREKKLTEIHVVGGLWRECNLPYYEELFSLIKEIDPSLHIKALTPVEYEFLSKLHDISIEEVFKKMISYGLESLPGGGAEILDEQIRKTIAPQKISSQKYMEIHELAHRMGLRSNITMLFGHIEDNEHIVKHLSWIRSLQDKTNGFKCFVPLKYHDENNALGKRKKKLKPKDIYLVYAISRLMLDNVPNIKVLWNYTGVSEAKEILNWGANDLSSTALDEKIIVMAGGIKGKMTREAMTHLIQEMGRIPKEIHSGYDYTQDFTC